MTAKAKKAAKKSAASNKPTVPTEEQLANQREFVRRAITYPATFTVEDGIVKVTVGGVTVTLNGPAAGCSTTE